ncbi:MAG: IS1634 family transposase, partial [Thermodesulfovibrionales bacterium]|nr:IS1634 family transposase [Thermodesulfovibrionales bacterium]
NTDQKNRRWEEKIDGVLVLETTEEDLSPSEIVKQYKNLQDVERGFRTLKSSLELRPMYHWTADRIRAHVFICVIALQLSRLMRRKLAGSAWSWEKAIERLRGIKTFVIKTGTIEKRGITTPDKEQRAICKQLGLPLPQYKHLASLH